MVSRVGFDIDWRRTGAYIESSEECIEKMLGRVGRCSHLSGVRVRRSAGFNGFHVEISCNCDDCYNCRLVFDSPRRLDKDLARPGVTRDVLWDCKTLRKGGGWVVGEAGPWMEASG